MQNIIQFSRLTQTEVDQVVTHWEKLFVNLVTSIKAAEETFNQDTEEWYVTMRFKDKYIANTMIKILRDLLLTEDNAVTLYTMYSPNMSLQLKPRTNIEKEMLTIEMDAIYSKLPQALAEYMNEHIDKLDDQRGRPHAFFTQTTMPNITENDAKKKIQDYVAELAEAITYEEKNKLLLRMANVTTKEEITNTNQQASRACIIS